MLSKLFNTEEAEERSEIKIEHIMEIFNTTSDFTFDDADERENSLLILSACLYSVNKREKICFISPTFYYAQKAFFIGNAFLKRLGSEQERLNVVVPGLNESQLEGCTVAFMHGKDFSLDLKHKFEGRKIIQIFPGEVVPVDPIRRSRNTFS
jgi:hypothetical protein